MTVCVVDSSVALAWVLPGESSADGDALLDSVADSGAVVPALWPLEIANILLMAERRRRITAAERMQALAILTKLPVGIDPNTASQAWRETLSLAAAHDLTVYDASYLELALRAALPLATLDRVLGRAARECGVSLIGGAA